MHRGRTRVWQRWQPPQLRIWSNTAAQSSRRICGLLSVGFSSVSSSRSVSLCVYLFVIFLIFFINGGHVVSWLSDSRPCLRAGPSVSVYIFFYICFTRISTLEFLSISIFLSIYLSIYIYKYMYVYICNIYICTYIHTYIHTNLTCGCLSCRVLENAAFSSSRPTR
jgi:hypothetical protein